VSIQLINGSFVQELQDIVFQKVAAARYRNIVKQLQGLQARGERIPHQLGRLVRDMEEKASLQFTRGGGKISIPGSAQVKEPGHMAALAKSKGTPVGEAQREGTRYLAKQHPSYTRWGVENM
jgi:hypothetical protein